MAKKVNLPEPIIPNDSWKVVKLGQYVKILNGYPFDSSRFTNSNENTYPLIRIRDVVRGYTETFTDEDCPDEYKIKKGEILIGMDGDFNISRWKSDFGLLNQRVCKISTVSKDLDEKFLFYYLPIPLKLINDATPSVTVKHLSSTSLQELHFPLPTLAEQQRIVNRIESMFAKLDEAKEKAQNVVDGFETRKAAILHKAFTGELTAKWRRENGVSDDSWVEKLFDSCIAKMQNGLSKRSGNEGEETVVLRLANMGEDDFDVSDLRTIKLTSKEKNNYSLAKNDVVMIRVNGSKTNVGRQLLVKNNKGWSFCDHIIRIQFEVFCLPNYMVYFSKTKEYIDYVQDNMVSSAGQNTISRKGLSNLSLKVPTLPEQVDIVRILDIIIEKENKAKQAAEAVLEQIDLLKKSILARAFRGEL